jgi:protocatechuate 3,4-dioxygenase beta subunit
MSDSNPNSSKRTLLWLLVAAGVLTVVTALVVGGLLFYFVGKKGGLTALNPLPKTASGIITPINLTAHYDQSASWTGASAWEVVPHGPATLGGVPFNVDGLLRLSGTADGARSYREKVEGISVGKKFSRLHLLHLTGATGADTPYARVVLRYADDSTKSFPLVYGTHARYWHRSKYEYPSALADPNSKVVWRGTHESTEKTLRLFKTTFENPKPDAEVATIDLVSETVAANAVILAMSVGPSGLPKPEDDPPSLPEPEAPYEGQMKFTAVDAESGKPVPGVKIRVSGSETGGSFRAPETVTDSKGECVVQHPGETTTSMAVSTFGDGVPEKTIRWQMSRTGEPIPAEYTFRVTKAVTMGGLVQDETGQPVGGAKLSLGQFTTSADANAMERVALGLTTPTTDEKGRWEFRSLPANFGNFSVTVSHPEYAEARFLSDGVDRNYVGEKISLRSLLETNAVLKVRKGLSISGRVLNTNGEPLSSAKVLLGDSRFGSKPNLTRTDERGEFKLTGASAGTTYLTVQASGHAPDMRQVTVSPNMQPFEIKLPRENIFKARVVDEFDAPVRSARITVDMWQNRQTIDLSGTTDSRGRVTIRSAPRDGMMGSINKSGFMYLNNAVFVADGEEHTFTLRRSTRITGSVVDAETKEPIDQFDVTRGQSYGGDELYWQNYNVIKGRYGEFSFALDQQNIVALRAEADDYLPTIVSLKSNAATHLVFELKKGSGPKGFVHSPDGKAVSGAQVIALSKGASFTMGKTRFQANGDKKVAQTSTNGAFSLRPEPDGEKIIAVHTNGYAEVVLSNFVSGSTITLQPWGTIEGVLKIGDALGASQTVLLTPETGNGPNRFWYDYQDYSTTTDAQGRFVISNVPPGERRLVRLIPIDDRSRMHSPLRDVTVKSGEVTRLTIGGDGTTVIGQLALSDPSQQIDWKNSGHHSFSSYPRPPMPIRSAEEYQAWEKSSEIAEARKKARSYAVQLDETGAFRIEDVLPGKYDLQFHVMQSRNASGQYQGSLGSLTTNIVVSARGDATKAPTIDLGRLEIGLRSPAAELKARAAAPAKALE